MPLEVYWEQLGTKYKSGSSFLYHEQQDDLVQAIADTLPRFSLPMIMTRHIVLAAAYAAVRACMLIISFAHA